jgi:hypothetical protein
VLEGGLLVAILRVSLRVRSIPELLGVVLGLCLAGLLSR